jgi:predicted naringenin-chalcone synthase
MNDQRPKRDRIRSRAFRLTFASLVILLFGCPVVVESSESPKIDAHQLREHLLKNLSAFADSAAAFVVCATDPHLPTDESLAWSGRQVALSEIVETISSHFGDKGLQSAFLMSTFTSAGDSNYKADVRAQTDGCSHAALQRATDFVAEARNIQKRYLAFPSDALTKHQLTGESQDHSSKSSVPHRRPGETIEQYLKRTEH